MKRKLLAILTSVLLLMAALPLGAVSASAATYGDLTYVISDGEVTITDCTSSVSGQLTIPSTIEGYPVTTIGTGAFGDCYSLSSVTIPSGVISIEEIAFAYCYSLTSITIPESVATIEDGVFFECAALTTIDVDENNPGYCDVDGVLFDKDKTTLIQYPIGKGVTSYTIPNGVITIGNDAFHWCGLYSVTIPDSVTTIEAYAFWQCISLTTVTIGDNVTTIGERAFEGCYYLESVNIPDKTITISEGAFSLCDSLTAINVNKNNPNYCDEDGVLFNKNKTTLIQYPVGKKTTSYTIPNGVTSIGDNAFNLSDSLESVIIPKSVTNFGSGAFFNCHSLTDVYYEGNETDKANISNCYLNATWHYNYTPPCDHVYDDEYDADCNECGEIREVSEKPVGIAYGDVDSDGKINNLDLAILQQYLNNWDVTVNEDACDVNADGAINNLDLARLQQYLNSWDVELG